MATAAVASAGATVTIKVGAGTAVLIKGLNDFSGLGGGSAAVIDVTDLDSPAKEKLMGVKDEGSVSLNFNYIAADAGQIAAFGARDSVTLCTFVITIPKVKKFTFDAFVTTAEVSGGVDQKVALAIGLEITGSIVQAAVTV
jgi:predicted secreted protein